MRSIFILYGRMALAAYMVLIALSCPGQADDYDSARANSNRLPIDQRYEMQALLGVAGCWPAVAYDEFNHRLFEAITHFQADNGFSVSGILTASQIDRVRQIADQSWHSGIEDGSARGDRFTAFAGTIWRLP